MKSFFISSTFKDMQAERDVLHEKIFPRLRKLVRELGDEVQEVDLRWGVDTVNMTEEESGHEVLRICIDAIDRCKPYLIVLLGERYGWIPGKDIVDTAKDTRISDRYEAEMSITELEIQYGALLNSDSFDKCVFCFRDPSVTDRIDAENRAAYIAESDRHAKRLDALKRQIRSREGAVILDYTADWDAESSSICGLDAFEEDVYRLLEGMIRRDFATQGTRTLKERQTDEVRLLREGYLAAYVRRYPEEFEVIRHIGEFEWNTKMVNGTKPSDCAVVVGTAGTGKSALMAFISSEAERCKIPTVTCFAAASCCSSPLSLKEYIADSLEELLGEEQISGSVDERLRVLNKKAQGKSVTCFVDALDQIYGNETQPYIDLIALCPDIFWVFSTLPDFPYEKALPECRVEKVFIGELNLLQREKMISDTAGKRGKKIDRGTVETITESEGSSNPLYLSLVLQRMFMMSKSEFEQAESMASGMEGLRRYMGKIIGEMPKTPDKMAYYILEHTAGMFGQGQFRDLLLLIAASHSGLTENELADLCRLDGKQFSPIGFQQTVSYLYDAFSQNPMGKWNFAHRLFGEAILSSADEKEKERIHSLLVKYSETDSDFMEKEGFRYVLKGKSDLVAKVLESSLSWATHGDVQNEVGCLARDSEEYRNFFIDLAERFPSEGMAEFWLDFDSFVYGDAVENMTNRLAPILAESETAGKYRWQLILKSLYSAKKDEMLPLINKASECCDQLEQTEFSIAMAGIFSEKVRVLTAVEAPYSEIEECRHLTVEYIDKAMEHLGDTGEMKDYSRIFNYMRIVCQNASSWDSPDTLDLWLHGLELTESIHRYRGQDEADYYTVTFLYSICKTYCKKQFRDYEKAKEYGSKALELADLAVSLRPTVRNLSVKIYTVYAYTEIFKEEYQYPYLEQAAECARRIWATQKNNYFKRELACAESEYAASLAKAINTRGVAFTKEEIENSEKVWEHVCELYEELIAENSDENLGTYATFLISGAEINCERGYYEKAKTYANRGIELLSKCQADYLRKVKDSLTEEARQYNTEFVQWCDGWFARAKGVLAELHLAKLELAQCEKYAEEAMSLSVERAKVLRPHHKRAIKQAVILAKSRYYQRKDSLALETCDVIAELVASPLSEGFDTRLFSGEENYIRGRIALERGQTEAAQHYCSECEKYADCNNIYRDTLLILKADLLTAQKSPEADAAWHKALKEWRLWEQSEKMRLEKDDCYKVITQKEKILRRTYRRESRYYAIAAYYSVYCLYHLPDAKELLSPDDEVLISILSMSGKGNLNSLRPDSIEVRKIEAEAVSQPLLPSVSHSEAAVSVILGFTDVERHRVLESAYPFILENSSLFHGSVPAEKQFNQLCDSVFTMYDNLCKERVAFKQAVKETEIIRNAFPLKCDVPVFLHQFNGYRVWSDLEIEARASKWNALLKLLLFALRYPDTDDITKKKLLDWTLTVYRGIADIEGGENDISNADISAVTDLELCDLISAFNMEFELRERGGFRNWYELKNIWVTEMYRRTGDEKYLSRRMAEFEEFLTDKYEEIYQGYAISDKKNMVHEISLAAMHLIRLLSQNEFHGNALTVARWMEANPKLTGIITYHTVKLLKAETDHDRQWLAEVKMKMSQTWLGAVSAGFWSTITM